MITLLHHWARGPTAPPRSLLLINCQIPSPICAMTFYFLLCVPSARAQVKAFTIFCLKYCNMPACISFLHIPLILFPKAEAPPLLISSLSFLWCPGQTKLPLNLLPTSSVSSVHISGSLFSVHVTLLAILCSHTPTLFPPRWNSKYHEHQALFLFISGT